MQMRYWSLLIVLLPISIGAEELDAVEIEETVVKGEMQRPLTEIFIRQAQITFDPGKGIGSTVDFQELIVESEDLVTSN